MFYRKQNLLKLILLPMAICLSNCKDYSEQTTVLKLGHTLDTEHAVHKSMQYMSERLEHYSDGTMRLELYPNAQLGTERELVELLQIGSLAMTKVSASPLESFVPEMKIFSLPYVFRDNEHYWQVLNSEIGQKLLTSPKHARLRGLGYYDAGSRSFYTNDRPALSPDDLKGLKIRVMKSQTAVDLVNSLGAAATPISWGELYTALQQGVVDGAENNPPTFFRSRHYEISKYFVLDEHSSVPDILLMSEHIWSTLSEEQQAWLNAAMQDSIAFQRELWRQATEEALTAVAAAGVEIITPDKAPFAAAVKDMKAAYQGTDIGDLLNAIDAIGQPNAGPATRPATDEGGTPL